MKSPEMNTILMRKKIAKINTNIKIDEMGHHLINSNNRI